MEGIISTYFKDRKFGFIIDENKEIITGFKKNGLFFHASQLPEGTDIQNGMKVSYDVEEGAKGKRAKNIVILSE